MIRLHKFIFAFLTTVLAAGCDSSLTVKDPNDYSFVKFYGGDGDQTGADVIALSDGTFILFGTTKPSGVEKTSQWYLVKADAQGNVLAEKHLGGPNNDEARDIELTSANTLVAVGNTYTTPADRDIKIMTLTMDFTPIDSATVTFGGGSDEDAASVTPISTGFLVAGSTSNQSVKVDPPTAPNDERDALQLKFSTQLARDPIWTQSYGPGAYDAAVKVVQLSANQYYVLGYSNKVAAGHPNGDFNYWVYSVGATGDPSGIEYIIGDSNGDEKMSAVSVKTTQGATDFIMSGVQYSTTSAKVSDAYVSKLLGTPVFGKPLSFKLGNNVPENTSVFSTQDGGFLLVTNEKSFNDNQNWMLTKCDASGTPAWSLPIIFGGEGLDTCGSVQELPDGRILLIGTMRTGKPDAGEFKMTLIKVNQDGKFSQ